jgi:HAD superfamily hydrolase (TIGR01493 family)
MLIRETTSIVLGNGKTRHQLDMTKSAGLNFDMLLSSELLGLAKPDPAMYYKAAGLLKCEPGECVMVSAHHDDLITAKRVYVCYLSIQYTVSGIVDVMGC